MRAQRDFEDEGQPNMTADEKTAPRKRVVIAEDEALIRMDLAEMLQEEGYDVVGQAGDGESAVKLATEHRPDLVIYLTDGYGEAPERPPSVPVIWCLTPGGEAPTTWGRIKQLYR